MFTSTTIDITSVAARRRQRRRAAGELGNENSLRRRTALDRTGPHWASRLRGHCGCGSGGHIGRAAARNGTGRGALHGRSRDLRADRQGRTHPTLRAQRRMALEAHPAQPSHQYRECPHRSFPQLHAAVLRSGLKEPRSLRPMARRPRQRGAQPSRRIQADPRVSNSCQHGLRTPPARWCLTVPSLTIT